MYEALTQSIVTILIGSMVLNFLAAEIICIFGIGRSQIIATAAGTAVSWIILIIMILATDDIPEVGMYVAIIIGVICSIIVSIVMPYFSFGLDTISQLIYKDNKRERELEAQGAITKRDIGFFKDSVAYYAKGADWNTMIDKLESIDLSEANVDRWWTENDLYRIVFMSKGDKFGKWIFSMEYHGKNPADVHGWEASFLDYETYDDMPSVETMNIILTKIEKIILEADPEAEYDIEKTLAGGIVDAVRAKIKGTARSIEPRPLKSKYEKDVPENAPVLKYCVNCGARLDPMDKFCINCGRAVKGNNSNQIDRNQTTTPLDTLPFSEAPEKTVNKTKSKDVAKIIIPILIGMMIVGIVAGIFIWKPWDPYVKSKETWRYEFSDEGYGGYIGEREKTVEYDSSGRIIRESTTANDEEQNTEWKYSEDGFLQQVDRSIRYIEDDSLSSYTMYYKYKDLGSAKLILSKERKNMENGERAPDQDLSEQYEYDNNGIPTKEVHTYFGEDEINVTYKKNNGFENNHRITGYDKDGNVVVRARLYDSNVVAEKDYYSGEAQAHVSKYEYYENGNVKKITYYDADMVIGEEVYDENGRCLKGEDSYYEIYEYDKDGTLISLGGEDWEYERDESRESKDGGRISQQSFKGNGAIINISYDWERKSKVSDGNYTAAGRDEEASSDPSETAGKMPEENSDDAGEAESNKYPIFTDENEQGYEAILDESHTFKMIGDNNDYNAELSYEVVNSQGGQNSTEVFGNLDSGRSMSCIGKYGDKFYFNETEGYVIASAVYTYKIGDDEFKKLADGFNFDSFKPRDDDARAGLISERYVVAHEEYPTDAAGGFGPLSVYDLNTDKYKSLGYVYDYYRTTNGVRWVTVEPGFSDENHNYTIKVSEYDVNKGKINSINEFSANIPDFNYGSARITESEVIIPYLDSDGNEREWRKKY